MSEEDGLGANNVIPLHAAERALRKRGPSFAMDDVAEAAGVEAEVVKLAFPAGRAALMRQVLANACSEFDDTVTNPMLGAPTPREALAEAADGLDAYYEGGLRSCLMELFSVPDDSEHLPIIKDAAQRFLDGLEEVFVRAGRTRDGARDRAHRLFAELQGTLVLGRITGDTSLFRTFTDALRRSA